MIILWKKKSHPSIVSFLFTHALFIIYRRKAIPSPSLTPPVQRSLSELSLAWTSVSEVTWGERDIIR